jgi:hypothetical protein
MKKFLLLLILLLGCDNMTKKEFCYTTYLDVDGVRVPMIVKETYYEIELK